MTGTRASTTHATAPGKSPAQSPARAHVTPAAEPLGARDLGAMQSSLTGGSALPVSTRKRLETSFGTDLGDVRVHTGGAAASATNRLQADAFASGRDIAFAPGRFRPGTPGGDHLIAEEVAHVIQQRGSGGQVVQRHATVSSASDSAETAARAAADNVLAGRPAKLSLSGLTTRGRIMRRARAGAGPVSPVVALPTNGLGATRAGPVPVLTPVMTSTLSPAGGKLVDSAARKTAGTSARPDTPAKAPDEAQTAQGGGQAAASAPNVMTAGSAAGAAAAPTQAEPRKDRQAADRPRDGAAQDSAGEKAGRDRETQPGQAPARGGAGGGGGGGGTFGRIQGDRGAAQAAAAQRRLDERADALATNEGADARIGAAQAAAAPPPNAAEAAGQQGQTATLEQAEVPSGDPATARQALRGAIASTTPGSIEDLENFASPGGAGRRQPLADAISGQAAAQTAPVRQTLSAVDSPPVGAAPAPAVPQPEPLQAPASADPALTQAVPPPVNEEALDATEFRAQADSALQEHDAGDETLQKADEGPLREIGNDKTQLNDKVDQAAGRARATETQARDAASASLANAQAGAQADMDAGRTTGQAEVSSEQTGTRTADEAAEQTLADRITATYQTAQTDVNTRLSSLTTDAVASFRERQAARLTAFASGVRSDLADLKRRRYSGVRGAARWVRDAILSINSVPEVQRLYQRHRDQYIADIDGLIAQITADIDQTIADCRATLRTARETIDQLVADNASEMDETARAALTRATEGFAQMEQRITAAGEAAKQALAAERARAITEMDAELDRIRSENAGLVDKLASAIAALAAALGQFMRLMTRVTRMGIGAFLSAALSQAGDGIRNNLWEQLQGAFRQWIFMKLPVLQVLLSLPPNWYEMLTGLAMNMIGLFTENLPALLPGIGAAAMIWLATTLATKLIPGAGAIMVVIDGIRGAYALVQSLFSAASAFFEFVMQVANRGNGAVAFARALAFGIVAALDAVLTFLGVDRLIRRVVGAIARPFGRIIQRIASRFRALMQRLRRRRRRRRPARRRDGGRGGDANARSRARSRARADRRSSRRRRGDRDRRRGRDTRTQRRESAADRRRRRQREQERRRAERLRRAVAALRPRIGSLLARGVSRIRLRAQLAIWRIRYRIRVLALQGRGSSARVVAANSPPETVRRVISGNEEGVYRMVHDIGRARFARARGRNAPGAQPNIQPGDDPSQLGAALRDRGPGQVATQPGNSQRLQFRGDAPMQVGNTPIIGQQGGGRVSSPDSVGNIIVPALGRYPQITQSLAQAGFSGPGVTAAVTQALRTGSGPPVIQNLIGVMFGAEPGRRPIAAATSPLALMAMQTTPTARLFGDPAGGRVRGDMFGPDMLDPQRRTRRGLQSPGGGIYPASAMGAAPAGRRTDARIIDGRSFREGTAIANRSRADLLRTVELVYQAVRMMDFSDTAGLRREILQLFDRFDRAAGVNP